MLLKIQLWGLYFIHDPDDYWIEVLPGKMMKEW